MAEDDAGDASGSRNRVVVHEMQNDDGTSFGQNEESDESTSQLEGSQGDTGIDHEDHADLEDEPLPRDHSYLSGSTHLLMPRMNPTSSRDNGGEEAAEVELLRENIENTNETELAILELPGVVLFPGSTIPIKLRDRSLISYLGHQIELCRNVPHLKPTVRLGILTYEPLSAIQRRRRAREQQWQRRRRRRQQQRRQGSNDQSAVNASPNGETEDAFVEQDPPRQRRSWFLSSRRRWRRRRNEENILVSSSDSDSSSNSDDDEDILAEEDEFDHLNGIPSGAHVEESHPFIGRIGTIATIQYTQERSDEQIFSSVRRRTSGSASSSRTALRSSEASRRYQELDELVFTAVGTGRFQVLAPLSPEIAHQETIFRVREFHDRPLRPPQLFLNQKLFSSRPGSLSQASNSEEECGTTNETSSGEIVMRRKARNSTSRRQDQVTWNLSMITPTPCFVYDQHWPWKVTNQLISSLEDNDGRSNLPRLGSTSKDIQNSPTQFSFWLASNMPFTESERLGLLQMHSTLERLRIIQAKVEALVAENEIRYLGCSHCGIPLSAVTHIFQFQGAEGATSNYVNDHGYIHQITTLRRVVDERRLFFHGPASTQNSYFPGFSWTITYCRRCASLLGWKFQRVVPRRRILSAEESEYCPDVFYGFQSSSVKTL